MDDCWDGELGDGSSQTLLPRWWDGDDGSPWLCPLWDEHPLVATIKWQRGGDGKWEGEVMQPCWSPWSHLGLVGGCSCSGGMGTSREQAQTALSQSPHVTAAPITRCPPGLPGALPAFSGGDKLSPTALSGQPTPRIQQNTATVPTPARALAVGCSSPQQSPSKPPQG